MDALPKYAEDLIIGKTYLEDKYYIATCIGVDNEIFNDGYNNYFKEGYFKITTHAGRFVDNSEIKRFPIKN